MDIRTIRSSHLMRWVLAATVIVASLTIGACGPFMTGSTEVTEEAPMEPYGVPAYDESAADSVETDLESRSVPHGSPGQSGTGVDAATVSAEERYIIRNVGVRIQVDDVEEAVESVREEIARVDGMVTAVQVSTDDEIPVYRYEATGALADGAPLRGYIVARVPADSLEAFVDAVSDLGTVQRQAEDESDVTQEHIDLSARLATLQAQETRLREFFEKAENVEEMLAIEQELTRVRAEIESYTAQIAYLERQASMATVTIELAGTTPVVRPEGSDWGFIDAITQGIRGFVSTINALIVVFMSALPLLAVIAAVALIVRWVVRRRRANREVGEPPAPDSVE